MIELFTRNYLDVPEDMHLTPIPGGQELSSLSAILLDATYYQFVMDSRIILDGVPTIPAKCLIPMKARAYLDLSERREGGASTIRENDVKKHRNDVFRLYRTLARSDRFFLPGSLRADLRRFLDLFPPESAQWRAIRAAVADPELPAPEQIVRDLENIFDLEATTPS